MVKRSTWNMKKLEKVSRETPKIKVKNHCFKLLQMLEYTFTKREKGKLKMQKADLFLQIVEQFESVRTEYRKLFSKWDKLEKQGDIQQADDIWNEMEILKHKMFDLNDMAEKLKVKK